MHQAITTLSGDVSVFCEEVNALGGEVGRLGERVDRLSAEVADMRQTLQEHYEVATALTGERDERLEQARQPI